MDESLVVIDNSCFRLECPVCHSYDIQKAEMNISNMYRQQADGSWKLVDITGATQVKMICVRCEKVIEPVVVYHKEP